MCSKFASKASLFPILYLVQIAENIAKIAHTRNMLVYKDYDRFGELPTISLHQQRHGNAISFEDYKWFDKKLLDKTQFLEACDKLEKLLAWQTLSGTSSATIEEF